MRVAKQVKWLVILGLVLVLLLAGCAKAAPTPAPLPTPAPAPVPTPTPVPTPKPATATPTGPYGTLTVAEASYGIDSFDPILGTVAASMSLSPIFDRLFTLDDKGGIAPQIVVKWEVAPDGKSWIYDIRKGIKFSNNEELTADDVKFSMDRYISPKVIPPAIKTAVERIEKVDDDTVRLYTIGPQPFLPYFSAGYSPSMGSVTPKDYLERVGPEYFNRHPIGSGPFKLSHIVPGDVVEWEAMDQHWRQVPAFKKLTQVAMPEITTRIASLKTGLVDITVVDVDSVAELEAAGFKILSMLPEQPGVIFYATDDPRAAGMPTTDIRVRQALSLAINRDEIIKALFGGRGGPNMPPYLAKGSADVDLAYWQDYCAKIYRYDPEEAKRLLKEAGYPQGFNIKLVTFVRAGFPPLPKLTEIIQGYWLGIGVKAELVPVDSAVRLLYNGFDNRYVPIIGQASAWSVGADPIMPARLRAGFHSKGSFALLGRGRPDVDKLIEDAQNEMDTAKRRELVAKAVKETVDSYTYLTISSLPSLVAVGPRVDLDIPPGISRGITPFLERAKHRQP